MTTIQLKSQIGKVAGKLSKTELESVLEYIKLLSTGKDWWEESSDEIKKGVEEGEKDFATGRYKSAKTVIVKYSSKYRRKK